MTLSYNSFKQYLTNSFYIPSIGIYVYWTELVIKNSCLENGQLKSMVVTTKDLLTLVLKKCHKRFQNPSNILKTEALLDIIRNYWTFSSAMTKCNVSMEFSKNPHRFLTKWELEHISFILLGGINLDTEECRKQVHFCKNGLKKHEIICLFWKMVILVPINACFRQYILYEFSIMLRIWIWIVSHGKIWIYRNEFWISHDSNVTCFN